MDAQRKTIQGLTVSLDEKREELSSFYRQFGNRLFADSSDPSASAGALSPDRVETWKNLMSTRSADAQTIIEIKTALVRLQELGQFRKEVDRNLEDERTRYRAVLEKIGRAFFESYTEDDSAVFGETYRKALVEHEAVSRLESRREELRLEIEDAGFFGKIFAQFRMSGVASNLRQRRARLGRILSDGAEPLVRQGTVRERAESGQIEGLTSDLGASAQEIAARLEDLKSRGSSVEQDIAAVRDMLETWGAADSPQRRMDELRVRVKDTDRRIDAILALAAREYSDKFLGEDGKSLLGNAPDGHSFSDMGSYAHQLEQISSLRSAISLTRRKIDVLETAIKIESIDRNVVAWERNIADYEKKIAHLQQLIAASRTNIEAAGTERIRLEDYRETLEKDIPGTSGTESRAK